MSVMDSAFIASRSLLRERWNSTRRLRRYASCGFCLSIVGLFMLYVTVDHLSVNMFLAHAVVVPAMMFVLSYFVQRRRTFGDRQLSGHRSKRRYAMVRFGGMAASKVSFVVLVGVIGLPYLPVSAGVAAGLFGPTYILNRDWAFAEEKVAEKADSGN